MIQLHRTPKVLEAAFPELVWRRRSTNEFFLTFDDGPHPEITPWVLDQLRKFDAKATFFCVGENLNSYPEVVSQMLDEGHKVANHTYNHLKGWRTKNQTYFENVARCEEVLRSFQNQENTLFRPPYGRIKRKQIRTLAQRYEIVMWSHLSWDFDKNVNTSKSIRSLKKADPGSIVVFHDSEKAWDNLKIILPEVLAYWNSLNYKFSTL